MSARILIADDSMQVRGVLKWLLESHSNAWKVCAEATDGKEAVQKAMETKPDLVILDLQMPMVDGLSASSRINQLLPDLPVLMFTLYKSSNVDEEAKKAGVREVVTKSDAAALVSAVEKVLGQRPEGPRKYNEIPS